MPLSIEQHRYICQGIAALGRLAGALEKVAPSLEKLAAVATDKPLDLDIRPKMTVAEEFGLDFDPNGEVDEVTEIMAADLAKAVTAEQIKNSLKDYDRSWFHSLAMLLSEDAVEAILGRMGGDNAFVEAIREERAEDEGGAE